MPIDISSNPDMMLLAEKAKKNQMPLMLKKADEIIAILTPVKAVAKSNKKATKTKNNWKAFLKTAGSLKGLIDGPALKKNIYESRRLITRPVIKL